MGGEAKISESPESGRKSRRGCNPAQDPLLTPLYLFNINMPYSLNHTPPSFSSRPYRPSPLSLSLPPPSSQPPPPLEDPPPPEGGLTGNKEDVPVKPPQPENRSLSSSNEVGIKRLRKLSSGGASLLFHALDIDTASSVTHSESSGVGEGRVVSYGWLNRNISHLSPLQHGIYKDIRDGKIIKLPTTEPPVEWGYEYEGGRGMFNADCLFRDVTENNVRNFLTKHFSLHSKDVADVLKSSKGDFRGLMDKLEDIVGECVIPGQHYSRSQGGKDRLGGDDDVFNRLVDLKRYTGTHKHRFNEVTGVGKGIYGRSGGRVRGYDGNTNRERGSWDDSGIVKPEEFINRKL